MAVALVSAHHGVLAPQHYRPRPSAWPQPVFNLSSLWAQAPALKCSDIRFATSCDYRSLPPRGVAAVWGWHERRTDWKENVAGLGTSGISQGVVGVGGVREAFKGKSRRGSHWQRGSVAAWTVAASEAGGPEGSQAVLRLRLLRSLAAWAGLSCR